MSGYKKTLQNAIRKVHTAMAFYLLCALLTAHYSTADIVKPALVEISVYADGHYRLELRASIEAMISGINSSYKNTQDSPYAEVYDELRPLQAAQLRERFALFEDELIHEIQLFFDQQRIALQITEINIPEPGYTKVPRISLIVFEGRIDRQVKQLSWYYPVRFSDNAVRVRQIDKVNEKWHWSSWQWLRNDQTSKAFSLEEVFTEQPAFRVILDYVLAGFEHIIPEGLDHILFILGIFLLSTRLKPLLWQATMFTLAHSITLSLSMFNIISLPASIVEPLIALSIAYIGIENIFAHKLKTSRLALVFAFGLLHGLGFASVLADFGMPHHAYASALIGFNLGVEVGQLTILSGAYFGISIWFKNRQHFHNYVTVPGSVLIGITGLYWTWDRFSWAAIQNLA
ncbi:Membrane protein [hydrothermal vent metagenome]|uniref:Membrane protein n=1 Tax=hydrothermal vent metagenome TaxID=652676 RepID=A0A3B0X5N0_9ZZZZ